MKEKEGERPTSRALRAFAGASLVTTMVSACARPVESEYVPTQTSPRTTEVFSPSETPLPIPTTEPASTPEPTLIPTEVPMYTGELIDASSWRGRGIPEIHEYRGEGLAHVDSYDVFFPRWITFVRERQIPDTSIVELVWGFNIKGTNYLFKILSLSTACRMESTAAPGYMIDVPRGMEYLEVGENYAMSLVGLLQTPDENFLNMSEDCNRVWGGLRVDSQDISRLRNFFQKGDLSGFTQDEEGIVDLTGVVTLGLGNPRE